MKVRVYRNLHKRCFSVQDYKTRKVIFHTESVAIDNPEFKVYQSGRNRVLREKRKNVHAYIVGELGLAPESLDGFSPVYYNPYKAEQFMDSKNQPIFEANKCVLLEGKDIWVA